MKLDHNQPWITLVQCNRHLFDIEQGHKKYCSQWLNKANWFLYIDTYLMKIGATVYMWLVKRCSPTPYCCQTILPLRSRDVQGWSSRPDSNIQTTFGYSWQGTHGYLLVWLRIVKDVVNSPRFQSQGYQKKCYTKADQPESNLVYMYIQ